MATISVDYDSNGDIDLILREKDNTCPGQGAQQAPPASEQEKPPTYNVGPICVKVKEFRLRVSSLKLISSSSYFQAMLEGSGFCEGKELKDHGFVKIELLDPEDEPTAMMIILGILYESDVQVPIELDLSTLNKVAVVADKYQWQALVTPHATSWVGKLLPTRDLLHSLDETLLTLLWIVWIFGMKNHFKILSKIAQQNILNSIDLTDESIRLPATVLKAINKKREVAFQKVEEILRAFKTRIIEPERQKEFLLPSQKMIICTIVGFTQLCSQDLKLGEFSAPDHAGISIRWLKIHIDLSQSMQGFVVKPPNGGGENIIPGGIWDLKYWLQKCIRDLNMDEWGLNYDDFKPSLVGSLPNREFWIWNNAAVSTV